MATSCDQHVLASLQDAANRTTRSGKKTQVFASCPVFRPEETVPGWHLLPGRHRCDAGQGGGLGDLPTKGASNPSDVTGDSVGRDVQRRRHFSLPQETGLEPRPGPSEPS